MPSPAPTSTTANPMQRLSTLEAARLLKVSDKAVREACKTGEIPHERRPGRRGDCFYYICMGDAHAWARIKWGFDPEAEARAKTKDAKPKPRGRNTRYGT